MKSKNTKEIEIIERVKVKVKDLKPNPFRNIEQYPISQEKVKRLEASIKETGFWPNILCRKRDGNFEIAYGHHRLVAIKNLFSPDKEISVIVQNLSDEMMIKIMGNENDEGYNCMPSVIDDTVKSAKSFLEKNQDVARKVLSSERSEFKRVRLGAPMIAKFLGENWKVARVEESLSRLNMIEEGIVDSKALYEFPTVASAMNFARVVKENKVGLDKQKAIAKEITKSKIFGKRSIEQTIWDFQRLKRKIKPEVGAVDFYDYQLAKSANLINSAVTKLNKFKSVSKQLTVMSAIEGRVLAKEDIAQITINKFYKAMDKLAKIYEEVSDIIKNLPSEED